MMTEEHLQLLNVNLIAQEMSMVGLVQEETLLIQAHALKFAEMAFEQLQKDVMTLIHLPVMDVLILAR